MKPVSPAEARVGKINVIPDFVIQAFNELIIQNLVGNTSSFKQDEVIARIKQLSNQERFDFWWLNVEEMYRMFGWKVEYEKPGYNETGYANYTFTVRETSDILLARRSVVDCAYEDDSR